jgi:hypothetical protein
MRKLSLLLSVLVFIIGMSVSAGAAPFTDTIDYWSTDASSYGDVITNKNWADAARISHYESLSYTHDITDDIAAGDVVKSANLELNFTTCKYDSFAVSDFSKVLIVDSSGYEVKKNSTGNYIFDIDVNLLNDDGMLDIELKVANSKDMSIWLDKSTLTGTTGVAPVPEPATMFLLAIGLIGIAGVMKKKKG